MAHIKLVQNDQNSAYDEFWLTIYSLYLDLQAKLFSSTNFDGEPSEYDEVESISNIITFFFMMTIVLCLTLLCFPSFGEWIAVSFTNFLKTATLFEKSD
jgi:hypothetical protein